MPQQRHECGDRALGLKADLAEQAKAKQRAG
jgi:hypothetical protein